MKQVVKKRVVKEKPKKKLKRPSGRNTKHHLPGTSKLEERFATDFLEKLGVKYIYQFEAKEIGRWYDFYLPEHNLIIEVDGSWYHSDPRLVKEDEMNPMQKRNKRIDEVKNRWALMHGIPILRIWEKDINESPDKVLKELRERLYIQDKKAVITEKKNKRHINKIK